MIKSCYIHIPFCNKICSYCDFSKIQKNDKWIDSYLDSLEKEIEEIYQDEKMDTIYIGGGTPSCLSTSQLKRLFTILETIKKNENVEYTIEGNFESTTEEKLKLYREYGMNRLSFGLESIHPNNLEFLHRDLDLRQVENVLKQARELGFHNINIDVMYALPTEDEEILRKDLEYVLSLQVEHISTYSLIIEKNTLLSIHNINNIDQDIDYDMYKDICKTLKENGYSHYEISNFAKEGYESRHNTTYWNNEEYYGFGLGASSYIQNKRIKNTGSLTEYLKGKWEQEVEIISEKEKIEYEVILNLRKKEGILLNLFKEKYHKELKEYYDYEELIQEELLIKQEDKLFIPEDKWYISNEIIVRLLEREVNE